MFVNNNGIVFVQCEIIKKIQDIKQKLEYDCQKKRHMASSGLIH